MNHDKDELRSVAQSVIRDIKDPADMERLAKLVERAARHYAEYMDKRDRVAELEAALAVSHDAAYADVAEVIGRPIKNLDFYQPHPLLAGKDVL